MLARKRRLKQQSSRTHRLLRFCLLIIPFALLTIGVFVFLITRRSSSLYLSPLALHPATLSASITGAKITEIRAALTAHHIMFDKVVAQNDTTYTVFLTGNGTVTLTSEKNITDEVSSLQLILDRLTMEGKHFARLDFRYAKPIIVIR